MATFPYLSLPPPSSLSWPNKWGLYEVLSGGMNRYFSPVFQSIRYTVKCWKLRQMNSFYDDGGLVDYIEFRLNNLHFHSKLHTLQYTLYKSQLYNIHYTLYTQHNSIFDQHLTITTWLFALFTWHSILYPINYTFYTIHYRLRTKKLHLLHI